MKRIIRLTENDLARIVRRVIMEQGDTLEGQTIESLNIVRGSIGTTVKLSNNETYTYTPENITTFPQMVYSGWCQPGKYTKDTIPNECSVTITLANNKRFECDKKGCKEESIE